MTHTCPSVSQSLARAQPSPSQQKAFTSCAVLILQGYGGSAPWCWGGGLCGWEAGLRARGGAVGRGGAKARPRGAARSPRWRCAPPSLPPFPSPKTLFPKPSMGARASQEPRARVGLRLLLLFLLLAVMLLALVAPGAQGARGRGAADKNSHRRAASSFSQSVSSLFGEDNVRAAQKVGGAPAVTLRGRETVGGGGAPWLGTVAACCSPGQAQPPGARDARALTRRVSMVSHCEPGAGDTRVPARPGLEGLQPPTSCFRDIWAEFSFPGGDGV